MPYMQNVGVLVFFVLSGFLIAYALERAHHKSEDLWCYLVDRFARIYTGLIPALICIAAIDAFLVARGLHPNPGYTSLLTWLGNVAMLQSYIEPVKDYIAVANYGSAGQLWTLAVEFHLYVFAGALYFLFQRKNIIGSVLLAVLFAVVPLGFMTTIPAPGAGVTWLWLMGFGAYFIASRVRVAIPRGWLWVGLGLAVVATYLAIPPGSEYQLMMYPLLALCFLLLVLATQATQFFAYRPGIKAGIKFLADFSFSLYLIHHSVLLATKVHWPDAGWVGVTTSVLMSFVLALGLALVGEMHHKKLAQRVKKILGRGTRREAPVGSAG